MRKEGGLEVKLVNACHVKNVPGCKSDVLILAGLRDQRCKDSEETIARSLYGNFWPEHLCLNRPRPAHQRVTQTVSETHLTYE